MRLLQTAETVEAAPDTRDALKAGEVSVRQANAIGAAEAVDPGAGQRLLVDAANRSTKETEDDAARVVRAASEESEADRTARHRKARKVFHGVNGDGMGFGGKLLPIAEHARVVAQLEGERSKVFDKARAGGEREPVEADTADAFCRVFDRAARPAQAGAGQRPIAVADAWRMIDGDAFVAAVATKGSDIEKVVHLGRKPTALQRTALEWLSAGECSTEGCTSPARIEIDHVAEWADTEITTLPQLASPCGHHHDLKTHHGYRFGPRLPSGKRRLLPPEHRSSGPWRGSGSPGGSDPPTRSEPGGRRPRGGPPGLSLLGGSEGQGARRDDHTRDDPLQGDLFDTG